MQVLWSRAAQTRSSCRCSACLHAASAIANRTTSAVSKRRLKIGDLFTACYSTILGTAVFADAKVKQERRKQWDEAIAEAKAGISMVESQQLERATLDHPQRLPSTMRTVLTGLKAWNSGTSTMCPTLQDDARDITLDSHLEQALATPIQTSRLSPSPEVERGWLDDEDTTFSAREPLTRLHLDKLEEMVSKLVTRLLVRSRDMSTLPRSSITETDISAKTDEIASRLQYLQGIDSRLPSYTLYDIRAAAIERSQLNNTLETLFNSTAADRSNINVILAKVCYNLLISSAPPNIQTYNILIRCLTRLRLHDLAQVVVDSFLNESKFKPTSQTIQLVLDHYSRQNDITGFRIIVNRMRAHFGDMRIKKNTVDSLRRPEVQEWATTRKVAYKGGYLKEKTPRDSEIFDSLINGFLTLQRLKAAVRCLRAALREGLEVSSKTLIRVVTACTSALDYDAGLKVLRALLRQWVGDSTSTIVYSAQARLAVHQLFGLCGIKPSLDSTRALPRNVSRAAVVNLQRHMAIQSIGEKIDKLATRIRSIEVALIATHDKNEGIARALLILRSGVLSDRTRFLQKVAHNEKTAVLREADTQQTKTWLNAQYAKLSIKWKGRYDAVVRHNPDLCWSDKIEIISLYLQGEHIPPGHRLFPKTWWISRFRRRRLSLQYNREMSAATAAQTRTVELKSDDKKSKTGLLSPSARSHKHTSSQTPTLSRTPSKVTLAIPQSPIHAISRLEASVA